MAPGYSTRIVRGMGLRVPNQTGTSTTETSPSDGAWRIYGLTPFIDQGWLIRMRAKCVCDPLTVAFNVTVTVSVPFKLSVTFSVV